VLTYHEAPEDLFDPNVPSYVPSDYAKEGFIHTTVPLARIPEIANRHYLEDPRPYLLLTIDLDRLTSPWRYDRAGEDFPHIYGPLNREAVVDIRIMPRAPDGTFLEIEPFPLAEG